MAREGREGRNDEGEREVSTNETLNLAEFVTRGSAQLGSDRAVLVVAETDDRTNRQFRCHSICSPIRTANAAPRTCYQPAATQRAGNARISPCILG